jgi:hypothetical protein
MLVRNSETLSGSVQLSPDKILNAASTSAHSINAGEPVLVMLAAGKGTRFGTAPKCIQPVCGVPLASHSINAFRQLSRSSAVCLVGYHSHEVAASLGPDNIYVQSENSSGGTAFAAFEAFCVTALEESNPVLVVSMGDRIVTAGVFQRLYDTHRLGRREADLTLLTAIYEPPKNLGKGRVVRDENRDVVRIVEQRDIDAISGGLERQSLLDLTEGNCPLYAIRAATLRRYLGAVNNRNAQGQFYFTDIVEAIYRDRGEIRTITTTTADPDFDLLCSDVTRPRDLALLEGALSRTGSPLSATSSISDIAQAIFRGRAPGQVASITAQLEELHEHSRRAEVDIRGDQPVGIGISGGRLRIAFMHPDMGRFYGPAWQMPIGAANVTGREQVVILVQSADDGKINLYPTDPHFREKIDYISADDEHMYPGESIADLYSYEGFGTRMAENLLLSLGYFSDAEIAARRATGSPLPPATMWVGNNMRRPFSLLGNAIASMRTLREGNLGARVQASLGRNAFRGLRVLSTGNIPQGGFSSSSAVTVAVKNAINSLFDLGISSDLLVQLACQAEFGTGVRAGALDQATEQKGRYSQGALISSNPRENYRILGTYPVPADRFRVLFPYSVDRDSQAWKWSAGVYADSPEPQRLTTAEMRKMTGKAAEIAAILVRLPLEQDFFQEIESDLIEHGVLSDHKGQWVRDVLQQLPLHASQDELRSRLRDNRQWYIEQLMESRKLSANAATESADNLVASLLLGWHDPLLRRTNSEGTVINEFGAPLRSMVGYLFSEVAKNCFLIHHPDQWIEWVSRSQLGDRCFDIPVDSLPSKAAMLSDFDWEKPLQGPGLLDEWLKRFGAKPFDYNRGLDDQSLASSPGQPLHLMCGTNFFRGLALIDLAEAMLKRAYGENNVAVRVNAAGQGDFFQVHVDTHQADPENVKNFLLGAFYRRLGLPAGRGFVEPHPGGGAVGIRLNRLEDLSSLIAELHRGLNHF